jgi:signal transduction histidine kinase
MRLSEFILHDMEHILAEWEDFAATLLPAASGMSSLALRDHAGAILKAIAKDLDTPQTAQQQVEKSKEPAPEVVVGAPETAAQTHAVLRAQSGFDINQLVAEYRALRASVLRLWIEADSFDELRVAEVIRFNEAIDEAIAGSVAHYHAEVERARNLLIGMLVHDIRSPLSTIHMTGTYLAAQRGDEKLSVAAARLLRSGASIKTLLDDLQDYNQTNLGKGMRVAPADMDLAKVLGDELDQLRGANPNRVIESTVVGDVSGHWDGTRLQQLVRNLVTNAVQYGIAGEPVRVTLRGLKEGVRLEVSNTGPTIHPADVSGMFDPLRRGSSQVHSSDRHRVGLGLFIVREIAQAHGGEVQVRSDAGETTFTVELPRHSGGASDSARWCHEPKDCR